MYRKKVTKLASITVLLFTSYSLPASDDGQGMEIQVEYGSSNAPLNPLYFSLSLQFNDAYNNLFEWYKRFAVSAIISDFYYSENNYAMTEAGVGIKLNYPISPYAGFGIAVGEHEQCTTEFWEKICHEESFLGVYPEFGARYSNHNLTVNAFVRDYQITDDALDLQVFGIGVGISFR